MHLSIGRISRKKGRDARLGAIQRLPPPDRLLCLKLAMANPIAQRDEGLWLELIQLASIEPPLPPSRPIDWILTRLGLPYLDLTPIREESLDLIASRWDRLPPALLGLTRAIEGASWSERAARLVALAARPDRAPECDPGPLRGLFELVKEGDDPAAWSALVRLATMPEPEGELADARILQLAKAALLRSPAHRDRGDLDAESESSPRVTHARPDMAVGLAAALASCFERRPSKVRRGTAWAAIALLESIPHASPHFARLGACMLHPDSTAARAMASVMRWDREPLFRRAALRWCAVDALGAACLERLNAAPTTGDHELILQGIHLTLRPSRAARLAMLSPTLDRPSGLLSRHGPVPTPLHVEELTPSARRMIPRWLATLRPTEEVVSAALDPLLTDVDPGVRLASLIVARPSEARDLCFDEHPVVATSAALRWSRAGLGLNRRGVISSEIQRVLRALRASPHATVRRIATEDLAGTEIWWPDHPASRLAARCTLSIEPDRFQELLAQAVHGADVGLAVRAIRMAERLRATDAIRAVLLPIVAHAAPHDRLSTAAPNAQVGDLAGPLDQRVMATIASALGCLVDGDAIDALLKLARAPLAPDDERIRANAVDALISHGPPRGNPERVIEAMLELKASPDHRVRGGVTRALARLAELDQSCGTVALDLAGAMLTDARPGHRLAALWAIEHATAPMLRAATVAGTLGALHERVASIARQCDPATETRALHVLRRISRVGEPSRTTARIDAPLAFHADGVSDHERGGGA